MATKDKRGQKGGKSSKESRGRGWFGDSEGHASAGRMSSGNRTRDRGRQKA